MIQIQADTRRAVVTNKELLTTGSAGIEVQFTLSEDWNGLVKLAVFRVGDDWKSKDIYLDSSRKCVVPAEALVTEHAEEVLFIGIYGSNGNGTIIIPTIWASAGAIRPGTTPNNPSEPAPTPSLVEQLLRIAQDAELTADDAYTMAENAQGYIVEKNVTDAAEHFVNDTVPDAIGQVEAEGDTQIERINQAVEDVQEAIDQANEDAAEIISDLREGIDTLEEEEETIVQRINSALDRGTDDTLSRQGWPADAKAAGDAIGDLNNALNDIIEQSPNLFDGVFVDGEQVATSSGAFVSGSLFSRSGHIPIKAGNIYLGINTDGTQAIGVHYCVYTGAKVKKSAGNISGLPTIIVGSGSTALKYAVLTTNEDGYFAFDVYTEYKESGRYVSQAEPTRYYPYSEIPEIKPECIIVDDTLSVAGLPADAKKTGEIKQSVITLEDALYELITTETTNAVTTTWTENAYMNNAGAVQSNTSYKYSAKIQVEPGDLLSRNSSETFRYVCAFSGNTAISSAGASSTVVDYTVPDGIDSIVVSVAKSTDSLFLTHHTVVKSLASDEKIATIRGGYLGTASSDTMPSGSGLYLDRSSIIRNKKYIFKANVTGSDWSVLVAHGAVDASFDSNTYSEGYIVTPTSIIPWSGGNNGAGGSTGTPLNHGLTIESRLCVVVSVDDMQKPSVMVMSESGFFQHTYTDIFNGRKGNVYAKAQTGTFTNCVLAFTCSDIEKPIWLFGDSYVSIVSNRYPYWLIENNVDNCLINSYPGEGSVNALKDLKEALNYGTPRYLIWALGMNDHDNTNTVNANWLSCITKVINLCEERGITLILATIPNVTNESYNNVYKNIWVEQSGYRYVDFNKAIGAADEPGATWPDGWLSSDNVHPTEMGARVLAMQIMVDVPELAQP